MTEDFDTTSHGVTAPASDDAEFSTLLGRGSAALEPSIDPTSVEVDCFPLHGVIGSAEARTQNGALRAQSAERAREVLARAEHEVRSLLAQNPLAANWSDQSGDIVARAQRQVREILAQGRNDAGVLGLRADADSLADDHIDSDNYAQAASLALIRPELPRWPQPAEPARTTATTEPSFATLRAVVLPSEAGALRYRVSGQLTLATVLAFQYAVSRLPGVDSARVDPEPDDVAVLSMMTNDTAVVQRLLERIPGVQLQMDPA